MVYSQELFSEETCIFGRPLVLPEERLVLLVKIEEALLPERGLGLLLLVVFRRILFVALLLVVFWGILAILLLFIVFRRMLILSLLALLIIALLIIFCRVLLSLDELRLSLNVLSLNLSILLLLMLRGSVHARCRVLGILNLLRWLCGLWVVLGNLLRLWNGLFLLLFSRLGIGSMVRIVLRRLLLRHLMGYLLRILICCKWWMLRTDGNLSVGMILGLWVGVVIWLNVMDLSVLIHHLLKRHSMLNYLRTMVSNCLIGMNGNWAALLSRSLLDLYI